jgi:hypothetical protein
MEFESINEALIACVKACGGSKTVGAVLWPDLAPDQAQRKLLNALDENRPENLKPSQVMLIFRLSRDKGFHDGIAYLLDGLHYSPTTPIQPKDQAAELMRQVIEGQKILASRLDRLAELQPQLREA